MANRETVKSIFLMVFFKFPGRRPPNNDEIRLVLDVWERIYKDIPDEVLLFAGQRFVAEKTGIYPNEDPFAMILEMARPKTLETSGDVVEMADDAVAKFGSYREVEAMAWIESKSELCAAAIRRFGFQNYCLAENAEVARGQLKSIFLEERSRKEKFGHVVKSANQFENGRLGKIPQNVIDMAGKIAEKMELK